MFLLSGLTSSMNAWNRTNLSVLLMLFTLIFTILRAFPVFLKLSGSIVESVSLSSRSGDEG